MSDLETPITVPSSALPDQTLTLIRYALASLGGIFVSKGYLSDSDLNAIIGAALIILPAAWGVIRSYRNNAKQRTMANALPDRIAKVV